MSSLLSEYRKAIESTLGVPLRPEEMVQTSDLGGLTAAQVEVARRLAERQLVLCTIYLQACAGASVGDAKRYIAELLQALQQ